MKKVCKTGLAALLSFVMLVSLLPIGAAAADETLIFEMDLSEYANGNTVKNSVSGSSSTITLGSGTPTLGTETGLSYLTFRKTGGNEATGTSIKVVDSQIAAAQALTVEAWVRSEDQTTATGHSGRIFGLGNNSAHFADYMFGNSHLYFNVKAQAGTGSGAYTSYVPNVTAHTGKWTHYVITRKLTDGDTDTCEYAVYINGAEAISGDTEVNLAECDSADKFLVIGAHKGGNGALWGDISTFKVYNSILTAADIAGKYADSKTSYGHEGGSTPDVPDVPDVPEEPEVPVSETLIAEENMSKYTVGEAPTGTNMHVETRGTVGDFSNLTVSEAASSAGADTIKYFELACDSVRDNNGGYNTYYGHVFSPAYTEDFVLDVNVQIKGSPDSRGLRWSDKSTIIHDYRISIAAATDEFGFHNLRYLFEKGADGRYTVTCYDLLDNEKVVRTFTTSSTTCTGVYLQIYEGGANVNTGAYLNVSKFKLMKYTTPEISATNGAALKRSDSELTLTLSEVVDESTLTDETIVLKNAGTGEAVRTKLKGYDAATKKATLFLEEYLDDKTAYQVSIDGVRNENGFAAKAGAGIEFTTADAPIQVSSATFKDAAGGSITALGTNSNISVTVNAKSGSTEQKTMRVFLVLYDAEGVVRDIEAVSADVGQTEQSVTATLSGGIVPKTGYSAKCYIWESTGDAYKVITAEPFEIQ